VILIASASQPLLTAWKQELQALSSVLAVTETDSLGEALVRIRAHVLVVDLDLPDLGGTRGIASLWRLHKATKIVVCSTALSDDAELALFLSGVRGCCRRDIDPQLLKRAVVAVQEGELWIRRSLTHRLLEELAARVGPQGPEVSPAASRLADLTEREQEIAVLVGSGESNKQIARRLDITERTVKAHLTQTFRKLGIADRLRLALLVNNGSDLRQLSSPSPALLQR
jgi:two-component system NarL family response regulator